MDQIERFRAGDGFQVPAQLGTAQPVAIVGLRVKEAQPSDREPVERGAIPRVGKHVDACTQSRKLADRVVEEIAGGKDGSHIEAYQVHLVTLRGLPEEMIAPLQVAAGRWIGDEMREPEDP